MSNEQPTLSEIYQAAGPSGEVDSRAGTVFITSIALLAFALARKPPEDIELFGIRFLITDALFFGLALWLVTMYSAVQLWIAWYTATNIFELKYGVAWQDSWHSFIKEAMRQREVLERVESGRKKNASLQAIRGERESTLGGELDVLREKADVASAALKAARLGGDSKTIAEKADEAEEADRAWREKREDNAKEMEAWDQEHPQAETMPDILYGALEKQRVNLHDASRFEGDMKRAKFLLTCRRGLELIVPMLAVLVATAAFLVSSAALVANYHWGQR